MHAAQVGEEARRTGRRVGARRCVLQRRPGKLKKRVDGARNIIESVRKTFGDKSIAARAGTWDAWLANMKAAKYDDADKLL